MRLAPAALRPPPEASPSLPTARDALLLAACFGLLGGYLDLASLFVAKTYILKHPYYLQGRSFPWAVPVVNLAQVMVPGLLVAAVVRLRPGAAPLRAAAWPIATLALWGPLLRMPLFGAASLVLAAGLGRWVARAAEAHAPGSVRLARRGALGLAVLVVLIAAGTSVRHAWVEFVAERHLAPPRGRGNVLLIVLDTVRAESLGLYGYARDTAPNLARWAKRGVRFEWALAPGPWTFPSHASLFTGQWPYRLMSYSPGWRGTLGGSSPTLAEYLSSRGYRTAGFVANTMYLSYESGLGRGFAHYDDYRIWWPYLLSGTAPGRWIVENVVFAGDDDNLKWLQFKSRDARGINAAFLDWLSRQGDDRPFFAFLNYLDAHDPFVPPTGQGTQFGLRPESPRDRRMLLNYHDLNKLRLNARDAELARDAYDDCIADLDAQIGSLLDELDRRGILRNTTVIVTSDHGEEFGEHGLFSHGASLYLHEVRVPLLILAPGAPADRIVSGPVSLRDVPATVVDLVGLSAGSPFSGQSLADRWREGPGAETSPALSEHANPAVLDPRKGRGPSQRGFAMSLVADGQHYIRDSEGVEELYDLATDPQECINLAGSPDQAATVGRFRRALLDVLTREPVPAGREEYYFKGYREVLDYLVRGRAASSGASPPGRG